MSPFEGGRGMIVHADQSISCSLRLLFGIERKFLASSFDFLIPLPPSKGDGMRKLPKPKFEASSVALTWGVYIFWSSHFIFFF
ncbi:hypothetical protein DC20_14565 [Rufibacter tibetensis]|uniref:Uncharacterized protein n=1 Tax=Rufibacter tibetensis TaxID=512763 RepID=A0A0P0CX57_9BACT|nr:hypothetical protein DC20_14565 [Rufibacter tibetensis]